MKHHFILAALMCASAPAVAHADKTVAQTVNSIAGRDQPCLRQRNIYDFQVVPGNQSLVVTDLSRRRYRLNFVGHCYELKHQFGLAFRTHGVGTLSCVERGDSVVLPDSVGQNECVIGGITYQTPSMDRTDMKAAAESSVHR